MPLLRSVYFGVVFILTLTTSLMAQGNYHYSYMPKEVYAQQVFSVTVVGPDDNPQFTFDRASPIQPLFSDPLLVKNAKDTFYTFYFKAGNVPIYIPILFIDTPQESSSLPEKQIAIKRLKGDSLFSSVLATDMKIINQQVSNYDSKNHMVTVSLEAYEANLEDMVLHGINEYGLESLKREHAKVTAEFYAVLPREQKNLKFSYYNTIKKRFIILNIPVKVVNASVTTQSDLNPKVDAFERLKKYTLIVFSLFFLIMFLWKRDFFYLILGIISLITLLTFYIPHKKICVKQGAPFYILPTSTSTVGTRIDKQIERMSLGVREKYTKIEYKHGMIGWIKNEDICKN